MELAKSGESVGVSLANTTTTRVYGAKFLNDLVAKMQGSKKGGNWSYRNAIIGCDPVWIQEDDGGGLQEKEEEVESRLNVMRIKELTYKWHECL